MKVGGDRKLGIGMIATETIFVYYSILTNESLFLQMFILVSKLPSEIPIVGTKGPYFPGTISTNQIRLTQFSTLSWKLKLSTV